MSTCSKCGKITTTKGEKGDTGEQGPQGPPGPEGGHEVENSYVLGNNAFLYNEGSGLTAIVGASDEAGQEIFYNGVIYVRSTTTDTITISTFGAATHPGEVVQTLPPKVSGGDTYTQATIPVSGRLVITNNATNFGFVIACASPTSEAELVQMNINFSRA